MSKCEIAPYNEAKDDWQDRYDAIYQGNGFKKIYDDAKKDYDERLSMNFIERFIDRMSSGLSLSDLKKIKENTFSDYKYAILGEHYAKEHLLQTWYDKGAASFALDQAEQKLNDAIEEYIKKHPDLTGADVNHWYQDNGDWDDYKFAQNPSDSTTISQAGCSVLAEAMAISKFIDDIDPWTTINYALGDNDQSYNYREHASKGGVDKNFLVDFASEYDIDTEVISGNKITSNEADAKLKEAISNGGSAVLLVTHGYPGNELQGWFTTESHYITIVGIAENGEYIIRDPNYRESGDNQTEDQTYSYYDLNDVTDTMWIYTDNNGN